MQHPINFPLGAQSSAAITTNTNTLIASGAKNVLEGLVVSNAGSAWTYQFFNGDPAGTGVAVGPAVTVTTGLIPLPRIGYFNNGMYLQTAGTTAGSLKVLFY